MFKVISSLIFSKGGLYVGVALFVVGSSIGLLRYWHYTPIATLEHRAESLEKQLTVLGSAYNICEAEKDKLSLEGFIDGIEKEKNETIIIDFSNAYY